MRFMLWAIARCQFVIGIDWSHPKYREDLSLTSSSPPSLPPFLSFCYQNLASL